MTKQLINGYFSSVPLAQLLTSTVAMEDEDEEQAEEATFEDKTEH
ncbi:MAG: hypothetical protein H6Q75_349 [Firmicutes bacterium]|nr:hypothetical protein [Bacillota bacterium]